MSMLGKIVTSIFGTKSGKDLKLLEPIVKDINESYEPLIDLSDDQLKSKFNVIKDNLKDLIVTNKKLYLETNSNENEIDDLLYNDETDFLNSHMVEVFAIVKEASKRLCGTKYNVMGQAMEWNMVHYDVQLIGGVALHQGKIAEMKTGEGKTLVATLPSFLNALTGNGVHCVTVNDYLARRDAEWMGQVHRFLGLSEFLCG